MLLILLFFDNSKLCFHCDQDALYYTYIVLFFFLSFSEEATFGNQLKKPTQRFDHSLAWPCDEQDNAKVGFMLVEKTGKVYEWHIRHSLTKLRAALGCLPPAGP